MRFVFPLLGLLALLGSATAGEQEAADALKKAKAQVTQDRKSKTVTEVRFAAKSHGDPMLDHVAECKELVKLFIAGPGDFSDDGLAKITGLKKLETVELLSPNYTDKAVAHVAKCPSVKWLGLAGTRVTDAAADHLKKMENLEMLSLAQTGVGNDAVAKLTALPQLKTLQLTGTKVDDAVFAELAKMKSLRLVALHVTKITPDAAEKFKKANPNVIVGYDPPKK